MGRFEARFPTDRLYCRNHTWLQTEGAKHRVGLTAYAVRLLHEVYFLSWDFDAPAQVKRGQEIGSIESSKAVSALVAPLDGTILAVNPALLDDPSKINTHSYTEGWLFEMKGDASGAMSPEQYLAFLGEVWPKTQQALKKSVAYV
jgi:glycine cleavage system H protein